MSRRYQCTAKTLRGNQCQMSSMHNADHCNLHGNDPDKMPNGSMRHRMFTMTLQGFMKTDLEFRDNLRKEMNRSEASGSKTRDLFALERKHHNARLRDERESDHFGIGAVSTYQGDGIWWHAPPHGKPVWNGSHKPPVRTYTKTAQELKPKEAIWNPLKGEWRTVERAETRGDTTYILFKELDHNERAFRPDQPFEVAFKRKRCPKKIWMVSNPSRPSDLWNKCMWTEERATLEEETVLVAAKTLKTGDWVEQEAQNGAVYLKVKSKSFAKFAPSWALGDEQLVVIEYEGNESLVYEPNDRVAIKQMKWNTVLDSRTRHAHRAP